MTMKIDGYEVAYPPTPDEVETSVFTVGVNRRTLTGKADVHTRAVKRRWRITMIEQGFKNVLIPLLDGTPFEFVELGGDDDDPFEVVLVSGIEQSGPPGAESITFALEEV